jgi:hypothetical protein
MSARVWDWPALELEAPAPPRLDVEWAVWGKVHGAASDYRWIAHSPGLDPRARRLQPELLVGNEDSPPVRASCWRALAGSFCAVSCYPSRAVDASRRSDFLEKQLLVWTPPAGVPATLGALLLLPRVARLTDQVWWDASADPGWSRADFSLALEPAEAAPFALAEGELQHHAEAGLAVLREAVGEEAVLADFFSALLDGQRPAILAGLDRPLPPEAVAALLLPLPRSVADGLSIAGWMLARNVSAESFRRLWDVLLCSRAPAGLGAGSRVGATEQGREAARSVFSGDPSRLRGRSRAPVGGVAAGGVPVPPALERLQDFATDDSRRWLAPEELGRPLRTAEGSEGELEECARILDSEIQSLDGASGVSRWRREHLLVKADLLRAAALALAPATLSRLGLPKSGRVPALLYCQLLAERDWCRLGNLGQDMLGDLVRQSLDCRPDLFGRAIREWLGRWASRQEMAWLAPVLDASRHQ